MKSKKALCLFLAGAVLLGSVALADVIIGDGYNGAKQTLKYTSKTLANDTDSFTVEMGIEIKADGEVIESVSEKGGYDFVNKIVVNESTSFDKRRGERSYYSYGDTKKGIWKSSSEDKYRQTNRSKNEKWEISLKDPFEEEYAADFEKIVDAFVSNMKDFVQTSETDGGKLYYGSLSGAQIPALVNAVSSFVVKYSILDSYEMRQMKLPELKDNIYIKEASGKAAANADGILESAVGNAVIAGTDGDGNEHTYEVSVRFSLSDINSTVISEPEMGGNVVISQAAETERYGNMYEKDIGTYRGDVIAEEDGAYKKVGERTVTITEVSDTQIKGHITVTGTAVDMNTNFIANMREDGQEYVFEYTGADGVKKSGIIEKDGYMNQYSICLKIDLDVEILEEGGFVYEDSEENRFLVIKSFE